MDTSINYSGFTDLYLEPSENIVSYECSETNEAIERVYNYIQAYKAGFDDRNYVFDN